MCILVLDPPCNFHPLVWFCGFGSSDLRCTSNTDHSGLCCQFLPFLGPSCYLLSHPLHGAWDLTPLSCPLSPDYGTPPPPLSVRWTDSLYSNRSTGGPVRYSKGSVGDHRSRESNHLLRGERRTRYHWSSCLLRGTGVQHMEQTHKTHQCTHRPHMQAPRRCPPSSTLVWLYGGVA